MSDLPDSANVVVIGAGIVGTRWSGTWPSWAGATSSRSTRARLPNPGGSTGHASNFIFPVDHSKEMTHADARQRCASTRRRDAERGRGGVEVARDRASGCEELAPADDLGQGVGHRRRWLVTPAEVKRARPVRRRVDHPAAASTRRAVAVVDSLRAGTLLRERAQAQGRRSLRQHRGARHRRRARAPSPRSHRPAATSRPSIVVDRLRRVEPARSREMAGASHPADAGRPPDDRRRSGAALPQATKSAVELPDRARHGHEHVRAPGRAGLWRSARTPTGRSSTSPTRSRPIEQAVSCRRPSCRSRRRTSTRSWSTRSSSCPDLLRRVGRDQVRDQRPALADARRPAAARRDARRCSGLWSAAAVWIKEGPGVGRAVAEWMTRGESEIDPQPVRHRALLPEHQQRTRPRQARAAEGFNKTYGIVHPGEQWASNRDVRAAPFHARSEDARRRLLRGRRLGAAALVRVERAARSRSTAIEDRASRVGRALVVADHATPSTWPCGTGWAWST